jgi:hypothetical protein
LRINQPPSITITLEQGPAFRARNKQSFPGKPGWEAFFKGIPTRNFYPFFIGPAQKKLENERPIPGRNRKISLPFISGLFSALKKNAVILKGTYKMIPVPFRGRV